MIETLEKIFQLPSPIEKLESELFQKYQVEVFMKRDDLIHTIISGNKWRKLKYALFAHIDMKKEKIYTFGGPHSNHIHACAYACFLLKIPLVLFIRGNDFKYKSKTITDCENWGATIIYLSYSKYDDKKENWTPNFNETKINEGGSGILGEKGCAEIVNEIKIDFDYITCPGGTFTTAKGILSNLSYNQKLLLFPAIKGFEKERYFNNEDDRLIVFEQFHFGGYAKTNTELETFILAFEKEFSIPIEEVYTAKMLFGMFTLIKMSFFKPHSKIVLLHTGGLQGKMMK
jgi:1-aminocyclopropane-1-carboxylate deaminase